MRIAAQLEDDGGKRRQPGRLLGDPQRVGEPWRLGEQQVLRRDAEERAQAPAHRESRPPGRSPAVPIHSSGSRALACLSDAADKRQRKAGDGPGIAGLARHGSR